MPPVKSAVKALIKKDNKYLFIQHDIAGKIFWDIPGGKIKYGETPYEAIDREVAEEVGLKVKNAKPSGVWWYTSYHEDESWVICHTFECELDGGEIDLESNPASDENIIKYKWISAKEFVEKDYGKNNSESFCDFVASLAK